MQHQIVLITRLNADLEATGTNRRAMVSGHGDRIVGTEIVGVIDGASANLDSDELEPGAGNGTNHGRVSLWCGQVQGGIKAALRIDHL